MPSEITFRNCIRAKVSFDMQPCLLCAGLVTSYLSKWSAISRFVRIAKTLREYMASGVTLPPLRTHVYIHCTCSDMSILYSQIHVYVHVHVHACEQTLFYSYTTEMCIYMYVMCTYNVHMSLQHHHSSRVRNE